MIITFGIALDGYELSAPADSIGQSILGPAGLLELLEMRLGLGGVWSSETVRIVEYQHFLGELDDGCRFFSASFQVDPFAVAETLLGWRDQWIESGWNGTAAPEDSQRLRDLADVERLATEHMRMGVADRLRVVRRTLETRNPGIAEVRLVDPIDALSPVWQEILALLPVREKTPIDRQGSTAAQDTDLTRLQRALSDNQPVSFEGDGSFFVLQAQSETTLARALAEQWSEGSPWRDSATMVLVGDRGHVLDDGYRAIDQPATGAAARSRWRPAAQVLPLALALLWRPLDPHRLLEFLTHPICPLRQPLRGKLARAVAEAPGIGGEAWRQAIQGARSHAMADANGDAAAGNLVDEQIAAWLDLPRFDPKEGAPTGILAEHCAQVAGWAARRAAVDGIDEARRTMFAAARVQAMAVADALDTLHRTGIQRLGRMQVDRLIDQVTSRGTTRGDLVAECGHVHTVARPAAATEPAARVLWWDFAAPSLPGKWPWTPVELVQLRARGAAIPSVDALLQHTALAWQRPILAAGRQCILVMPRWRDGETFVPHPLWDQIAALSKDGSIPTLDLDRVLEDDARHPWLAIRAERIAHRRLPGYRRWWRIDDPTQLGKREIESFSSLLSFVNAPHQWVLNYKARLRPGALAKIEGDNRQKGALAHRLIEWLFTDPEVDWRTIAERRLERWLDARIPLLLEQEGANLLLPGRARDEEEFRMVVRRATWALLQHLRSAHVETVLIEKEGLGHFCGGNLGGRIDMLVGDETGREAVLDLKWGGFRYRCQELEENRQLQLAVYARMRRQATGAWPSQGYFILDAARLAAQDRDYFTDGSACAPSDPAANTLVLWSAFEVTWQWRRHQLDRGLIEVNVEATEPDEASEWPERGLSIAEANDRFDDYVALAGWPEGA